MAGHSKWSKVKRVKGVIDAKRGQLFSRLSKEISVAARMSGGNPDFNPRLRAAIQSARDQSMPNENIERAIKKGTGELGAALVEEMIYEGYGPAGIAIMVEAATDNKNRTAADMRSIFSKNNGHLGGPGSVAYLFKRKGQIEVSANVTTEDQLLEIILDAGAEEMTQEDDVFVVTTPPDALYSVAEAIRNTGIHISSQKLTYIPETTNSISDEEIANQALRLCDALDECEDVLNVHANFNISEELMVKLEQ